MTNPLAINRKWLVKVSTVGLAICALAVACGQAKAEDVNRIGVHIGSVHFPAKDYNNFNPGVYVYHNGWTAGTYYNSERHQSFYAGYTFEYAPSFASGMVRLGATVGAITGYERAKLLPMVVPSVSVSIPGGLGSAVRIAVIPPLERNGSAVLHLALEARF